ncbi:hypothetical protein KSZ_44090 [Dictyobacter formicarum]|uniref:Uncharacterized protein n=1 Tax=Dictyobacter formicarum TaxID=2778368 RepID=A0ABQ3VM17_9CHLR|nr:hypothetical protein KSZ_44090 [Dictyobacter formicarum]
MQTTIVKGDNKLCLTIRWGVKKFLWLSLFCVSQRMYTYTYTCTYTRLKQIRISYIHMAENMRLTFIVGDGQFLWLYKYHKS